MSVDLFTPEERFSLAGVNQRLAGINESFDQLERNDYAMGNNIFNLILQQYYNGKYTGYKKALLFDGLNDMENISERNGLIRASSGFSLCSQGADAETTFQFAGNYTVTFSCNTLSWVSFGNGVVTKVTFRIKTTDASVKKTIVNVAVNDIGTNRRVVAQTKRELSVDTSGGERYVSFTGLNADIAKGGTYQIQLWADNGNIRFGNVYSQNTQLAYAKISVDPIAASSGSIISKPATLPQGKEAYAWVRHSANGTASMSMRHNGVDHPMTKVSTYDSVELKSNTACKETEFRLASPIEAGNWQAVLGASLNSGEEEMFVYDYGIIVL